MCKLRHKGAPVFLQQQEQKYVLTLCWHTWLVCGMRHLLQLNRPHLEPAPMYDEANESVTVTSQHRQLPPCQGIKVSPSGRLPSERIKPDGSLTAGTSTRRSALYINHSVVDGASPNPCFCGNIDHEGPWCRLQPRKGMGGSHRVLDQDVSPRHPDCFIVQA